MRRTETQRNFQKQMKKYSKPDRLNNRSRWSSRRTSHEKLRNIIILAVIILLVYFLRQW